MPVDTNMSVFSEKCCCFIFLKTISVSDNQLLIQLDAQKALVGATPREGKQTLAIGSCSASHRQSRANAGLKSCWSVSGFTRCNTTRRVFHGEPSDKICLSLCTVYGRHYFLIGFLLESPDSVRGISFCSYLKAPTLTSQVWGRFWLPRTEK